jgi:hypothetical protein
MCRSQSVKTINSGHIGYEDDSIDIVFHKSKANQDGNGSKDPRHFYANPFPHGRAVLRLSVFTGRVALIRVLVQFSLVLCSEIASGMFFSRALHNEDNEKNYGTHSMRKGVAMYACNGSTEGPSIVSVYVRCGWSLGGVQDRYFRYEAAGDQFIGRVVAGLHLNSSSFEVLPPHLKDNMNSAVRDGVHNTFSALASDSHLQPTLKLCLASLVFHYNYLLSVLPMTHSLRGTILFRVNNTSKLLEDQLVRSDSSWMTPTGIPP